MHGSNTLKLLHQPVKMNTLYLINKIMATDYKGILLIKFNKLELSNN